MTTEEKAKAYDGAIAKAQKELQTCGSTDCDAARQIYRFFPELSESEDERIRKSIIAIINNYVDNSNTFKPKMIAWLEMQGKEDSSIQQAYKQGYIEGQRIERKCWLEKQSEKPTLPKWKYKKDNTPLLRDSIILNKYGCVFKSPSGAVVSDAWVLDYDELAKLPKEEIAKQDESKYIPKYKIGDYVKNTNYKGEPIYEIIYMDKECYICEYRGKERMGDKAVMHFSFDNPYLCLVQKPADIEQNFSNSEKVGKNDTLLDLLNKMPSCITVNGIDYYFVMKKTSIYTAYYKALKIDSPILPIFWMTSFSPVDLLTEMLEELKKEGLL